MKRGREDPGCLELFYIAPLTRGPNDPWNVPNSADKTYLPDHCVRFNVPWRGRCRA